MVCVSFAGKASICTIMIFSFQELVTEPKREKPKPPEELGIVSGGGLQNILAVYRDATPQEQDYWGRWYHHAKEDVSELSQKYNIPFVLAAAVTAVLSPGNNWGLNIMAAERVMSNINNPVELWPRIPGYGKNVAKARQILLTGDTQFVIGPKVTVFFQSLLDPEKVKKQMVLDGHAINIWRGEKPRLKGLKEPSTTERKAMLDDYSKAAEILGVSTQAVQAVTWYIWKYTKEPARVRATKIDTSEYLAKRDPANDNAVQGTELAQT